MICTNAEQLETIILHIEIEIRKLKDYFFCSLAHYLKIWGSKYRIQSVFKVFNMFTNPIHYLGYLKTIRDRGDLTLSSSF